METKQEGLEIGTDGKRAELLKAIQDEERERMRACSEAISAALAKHQCSLIGVPQLVQAGGGFVTVAGVQIVPNPPEQQEG